MIDHRFVDDMVRMARAQATAFDRRRLLGPAPAPKPLESQTVLEDRLRRAVRDLGIAPLGGRAAAIMYLTSRVEVDRCRHDLVQLIGPVDASSRFEMIEIEAALEAEAAIEAERFRQEIEAAAAADRGRGPWYQRAWRWLTRLFRPEVVPWT